MEGDTNALVTVLEPNNPAVIALAKSILDDAEIPHVVTGDEALQSLYGVGQVQIQVPEEHAEGAQRLLVDL